MTNVFDELTILVRVVGLPCVPRNDTAVAELRDELEHLTPGRGLDKLPDLRTEAVAAAVLRMSGRSDKPVWENPFYVPNRLVYQVICKEFGLFAPDWYIKKLVDLNRQCYLNAAKQGNSGKYERWQIIE